MNLFDAHEKLKKYANIYDIIDDYYSERLSMYSKRKLALLAQLSNELKVLSNRAKYIQEILDDKLDMRRKTKEVVFEILKTRGYDHIEGDEEYRYLLKMPMDSVTEENVTKLLAERDLTRAAHTKLTETSIEELWTKDLDELEQEYKKWVVSTTTSVAVGAGGGVSGGKGAATVKKKLVAKKTTGTAD
jgi:DNA topoisomerase-2